MTRRNNAALATPATPSAPVNAYAMTSLGDTLAMQDVVRRFRARRGLAPLPPRCETCRNTGYLGYGYCACAWGQRRATQDAAENVKLAEARDKHYADLIDRKLNLPEKYRGFTFDTHPMRQSDPETHRGLITWAKRWDGRRGLILRGPVGSGKTGYMVAMLQTFRERAIRERWYMRFLTSLDLFTRLQAGFKDNSYHALVQDFSTVRLLALDDLGAEHVTDWRQDQLFQILNARAGTELPLLATTNSHAQVLRAQLTPRVYSRLMESCDVLDVVGPDLRDPDPEVEVPWWAK